MTYNITQFQESASIAGIVTAANDYTNGLLLGLLILAIFFILLMALKKWAFEDSLLASSFVCFLLSAILGSVGLLNLYWTYGFLVILAFTTFYMFVSK